VAVEVELSYKSPRRFDAILAGYELSIARGNVGGGLLYVSARADVLAAVTRAAHRSGVPESRFRARMLADSRTTMLPGDRGLRGDPRCTVCGLLGSGVLDLPGPDTRR